MDRRRFLTQSLKMTLALGLSGCSRILGLGAHEEETDHGPETDSPSRKPLPHSPGPGGDNLMPTRPLGNTGFQVSILGLGGEAAVEKSRDPDRAVEIINRALDLGINYIDTAPTYGGGGSESNIGRVMKERRSEAFLATKTRDRSYDGTMRLCEASLDRLQTDYLDLYQLHNLRTREEVSQVLSPSGAVKALERLQREGVIKHLGVTGHRDPDVLLQAIQAYDFDCVLMTLNAADRHHSPFQTDLLETARQREMGTIAMKVTARGRIFGAGGLDSMQQALGYTLTLPVSTAIVGVSTLEQLEENAFIARSFEPLSAGEMEDIENLTRQGYREGNFFKLHW